MPTKMRFSLGHLTQQHPYMLDLLSLEGYIAEAKGVSIDKVIQAEAGLALIV